jgi:hypothetical protein
MGATTTRAQASPVAQYPRVMRTFTASLLEKAFTALAASRVRGVACDEPLRGLDLDPYEAERKLASLDDPSGRAWRVREAASHEVKCQRTSCAPGLLSDRPGDDVFLA